MKDARRFEIKLPAEQRAQLEVLAVETGVPSAALARLAVAQMLAQRAVSLPEARDANP